METHKKPATSWLERVEDLINVLEGSSVGELELTEDDTEIVIRRRPDMVLTTVTTTVTTAGTVVGTATATETRASRVDTSIPIVSPMTGVYYSAPSPSDPPFANIGDIVQVGQVVALVEAMKVFNEINAEVSGRVVAMPAPNGQVVQKNEVLLRVEPL